MAAQALAAMRREQPGDRIGPWQLARLLAEGGMGAVWVAQRVDGVLKRTAALKLPRAEWVDHGLSERIARERAILARLQHPAIAVLYDAGVTSEGRPYLALEYVDGVPIDAYCQGRELNAVLRLFVQVIRAVAYAHGQLVIHRDLKPANVLVTADGLPKLLDFGISKLIEGDATSVDATALTRLAGRPLTLAYAAPEQVLSLPITVAADVYALGVMLCELLTATRLYRAATPRALEEELLRGDLRKPSDVAADKTRAKALKGDLDAIVLTALKRQPGERYQSATALADDLQRYLDGQPVTAQPDSRAYRLRKFVTRNALPAAAGSAVVIALVIGAGVALWQADVARDQATRATAMNTFVLSLIQQADPNASQQTKAADLAMLTAIEQRIDAEFKGSPDQLLQLRVTIGDAYKNRGETAAARRVFQRAVDEATPHLPKDHLPLLRARVLAADFNLIVSIEKANDLAQAIDILRTKGADGAGILIDALLIQNMLGRRFHVPERMSLERMEASLQETHELATRYFGAGSRERLKTVETMAFLLSFKAGHEEAAKLLRTEIDLADARPDVTDSAEYLTAKSSYGGLLCNAGQHADGVRTVWDVLARVQASHGAGSLQLELPLTAMTSCMRSVADPSTVDFALQAFEAAAAREQPPSSNLMRRAEFALYHALDFRQLDRAGYLVERAVENGPVFPEEKLRERFVRRVVPGHVAWLAFSGETEAAEMLASKEESAADTFYAYWLHIGQSFAQRQNGRYAAAIATARKLEEFCPQVRNINPVACATDARVLRAAAQLDAGDVTAALASANEALEHQSEYMFDPQAADLGIVVGRARLANGLAKEALEPLRQAYGFWLGRDAKSVWAAEAEYWFGRAWIVNGEVKRGRWMVAQAKRELAKSPIASHRALAQTP